MIACSLVFHYLALRSVMIRLLDDGGTIAQFALSTVLRFLQRISRFFFFLFYSIGYRGECALRGHFLQIAFTHVLHLLFSVTCIIHLIYFSVNREEIFFSVGSVS